MRPVFPVLRSANVRFYRGEDYTCDSSGVWRCSVHFPQWLRGFPELLEGVVGSWESVESHLAAWDPEPCKQAGPREGGEH